MDAEWIQLPVALHDLPRTTLQSDFHCVTTWSCLGLRWSGVRFSDFYNQSIAPLTSASGSILSALLRGQDGYRTTLLLEDLMDNDVLIADRLDGQPLSIAHGAPLRLVAPKHYGYKSVKHLCSIEFVANTAAIKHGPLAFLDHPRARVAQEERGRWFPGWLLRRLYWPMIRSTARQFGKSLATHEAENTDS